MAILNKRISSATLPQVQSSTPLSSIIQDVKSAPATQNEMYRTINPSASTNQTPSPAYVSQLTSALREMQPQNYTSMVAPTRSNNVSLMSSQMPDMSNAPNISKGPITSITSSGDSERQKIGTTTSTSGGLPAALINALAGAVMGAGASKLINGKTTTPATGGTKDKTPPNKAPVTSTVSTLPTWAKGNPTIKDNGNGTYTQTNDDGSTSTMDKDGNIIGTTDSNGDIVDKNGSTVHDNGDGTHTTTTRGGTVTIRNDEGNDITPPIQEPPVALPPAPNDDYNEYSIIDDTPVGDFKRGGLAVMMKDGGVPHFAEAGPVWAKGDPTIKDNGNGTYTQTMDDGSTILLDKDGAPLSSTDKTPDPTIDSVQSILDLLKTTGGAAGAGGILAALLSSTGGNTNTVNTGLDMSTYGLLKPRTTGFGMGPAKYVSQRDYSPQSAYKRNDELLHSFNAPASNPVNEGDYTPNYVTNRPNTNQNLTGSTDINAIIAQIVNALKNRQLAQNVNQASGTGTPNAPAGGSSTPAGGSSTPAASTPTDGGFVTGGGGTSKADYDRAVATETARRNAEKAELDKWNISPSSRFYAASKGLTGAALDDLKRNDKDEAERLARRTAISQGGYGGGFIVSNGTLMGPNGPIYPNANETDITVTDAKTGLNRYQTKAEAAAQDKATQDYLMAHGNIIDPNKPWNVGSTDAGTQSVQQALAKLSETQGTPAERQAALTNFLKTTSYTPEQLAAASNGLWGVNDLKTQMAGNPIVQQTDIDIDRPTSPSRSRALGVDAGSFTDTPSVTELPSGYNPNPIPKNTSYNTESVDEILKSVGVAGGSTALTPVNFGGIQEVDPYSPSSQMVGVYPQQPISYGGDGGLYGPGGMFPSRELDPYTPPSGISPYEGEPRFNEPTPAPTQTLEDYYSPWDYSGAKNGGAIHKATGGLTHYTFGKPADVMENLGLRQQQMARGGLPHVSNVPVVQGRMDFRQGSAVHGEGDGQSDDIPAMLADGEYVIDAETVAQIGNGSTKAGAQALDKFRENIRAHKRNTPINKIPPKTKALTSYLKVK